ncbi:hypothetical protein [Halopelagius fulvigenes]|uniref:Cyanovirin-N domain-containing protein n=1 Tax=Halopelagius fulvigenes TaxID=1198324 RepID=A0ABD5TX43_9EURY
MKQFSTSDGDEIRVECEETDQSFSGSLSLVVSCDSDADVQLIDGVLTSSAHGDEIHSLFACEAEFRIIVESAGSGETIVYENCTLLSSSGKWTASDEFVRSLD